MGFSTSRLKSCQVKPERTHALRPSRSKPKELYTMALRIKIKI